MLQLSLFDLHGTLLRYSLNECNGLWEMPPHFCLVGDEPRFSKQFSFRCIGSVLCTAFSPIRGNKTD